MVGRRAVDDNNFEIMEGLLIETEQTLLEECGSVYGIDDNTGFHMHRVR
jgi:hypothetical protein